MDIIYKDDDIVVAIKPSGVLSTDEPGGMPELVRSALGDPKADIRTVHRLDQVVGGLMVFARSAENASKLSAQITGGSFGKEYLAVVHFRPHGKSGTFTDLLRRDPAERKTYVTKAPGKGVQKAELNYEVIESNGGLSLVRIHLITGRTHQIRAQFSSRGLPLVGDRKYGVSSDDCPIALWSCALSFSHPVTGKPMKFEKTPPDIFPWTEFKSFSGIADI